MLGGQRLRSCLQSLPRRSSFRAQEGVVKVTVVGNVGSMIVLKMHLYPQAAVLWVSGTVPGCKRAGYLTPGIFCRQVPALSPRGIPGEGTEHRLAVLIFHRVPSKDLLSGPSGHFLCD